MSRTLQGIEGTSYIMFELFVGSRDQTPAPSRVAAVLATPLHDPDLFEGDSSLLTRVSSLF